jgi:hypothetical protein
VSGSVCGIGMGRGGREEEEEGRKRRKGGRGGIPFTSYVRAGVGPAYFFFGFESAGTGARLCEERAGEVEEGGGEVVVKAWEEGGERLLD